MLLTRLLKGGMPAGCCRSRCRISRVEAIFAAPLDTDHSELSDSQADACILNAAMSSSERSSFFGVEIQDATLILQAVHRGRFSP